MIRSDDGRDKASRGLTDDLCADVSSHARTDLADLIARVERLEGPSEEVDALVLCALAAPAGSFVDQSKINGAWCVYTSPNRLWEKRDWWRAGKWPVTESVDAALALVERVGAGQWFWQLGHDEDDPAWFRARVLPFPRHVVSAEGPTPALALILALLHALEAKAKAEGR